jgi:hypothetical protein
MRQHCDGWDELLQPGPATCQREGGLLADLMKQQLLLLMLFCGGLQFVPTSTTT